MNDLLLSLETGIPSAIPRDGIESALLALQEQGRLARDGATQNIAITLWVGKHPGRVLSANIMFSLLRPVGGYAWGPVSHLAWDACYRSIAGQFPQAVVDTIPHVLAGLMLGKAPWAHAAPSHKVGQLQVIAPFKGDAECQRLMAESYCASLRSACPRTFNACSELGSVTIQIQSDGEIVKAEPRR